MFTLRLSVCHDFACHLLILPCHLYVVGLYFSLPQLVILQGHGCGLGASQTEIAYIDTALTCQKYILRLEVSMHHIGCVQEVHGAEEVVHDRYDVTLRE